MFFNKLYLTKKNNVLSMLDITYKKSIFIPKDSILLLIDITEDFLVFFYRNQLVTFYKHNNMYYMSYLEDITLK